MDKEARAFTLRRFDYLTQQRDLETEERNHHDRMRTDPATERSNRGFHAQMSESHESNIGKLTTEIEALLATLPPPAEVVQRVEMADPYVEGINAAHTNQTAAECPYAYGSTEGQNWIKGYTDAGGTE